MNIRNFIYAVVFLSFVPFAVQADGSPADLAASYIARSVFVKGVLSW